MDVVNCSSVVQHKVAEIMKNVHVLGFFLILFICLPFFPLKSTLQLYLDTEDVITLYLMLCSIDVGS